MIMSRFTDLKNLCIAFEQDLRNVASQCFTARIGKSFEDEIADKMQDLSLFTSKLRLLQAQTISMTTQCPPALSEEDTLAAYDDMATWKVIEQQTVKASMQSQDVRALRNTPDSKLDPALVARKHSITSKLQEYRIKETALLEADTLLQGAESERHKLRTQWEAELGQLKSLKQEEEAVTEGPLYEKMNMLISKIDTMRWLMSRLVTARAENYDWLSDPDRRLRALKMAREPNTVEFYTRM